jgi:hypothetical protein
MLMKSKTFDAVMMQVLSCGVMASLGAEFVRKVLIVFV